MIPCGLQPGNAASLQHPESDSGRMHSMAGIRTMSFFRLDLKPRRAVVLDIAKKQDMCSLQMKPLFNQTGNNIAPDQSLRLDFYTFVWANVSLSSSVE